jgi:hypothetical protein
VPKSEEITDEDLLPDNGFYDGEREYDSTGLTTADESWGAKLEKEGNPDYDPWTMQTLYQNNMPEYLKRKVWLRRDRLERQGAQDPLNMEWFKMQRQQPTPGTPNDPYQRWSHSMRKVRTAGFNLVLIGVLLTTMTFASMSHVPWLLWLVASGCATMLARRGVDWQRWVVA